MGSAELSCAGGDEYYYYNQQAQYFLEACSLCQKPLGHNSDIFMYRGNTPFCSEECRQEQIEMDEAKKKSWKNSKRALRQTTNDSTNKESTPNKAPRRGTVAVA